MRPHNVRGGFSSSHVREERTRPWLRQDERRTPEVVIVDEFFFLRGLRAARSAVRWVATCTFSRTILIPKSPLTTRVYDGCGFRSCVLSHVPKRNIETKLQINTSPAAGINTMLAAVFYLALFNSLLFNSLVSNVYSPVSK